MDEGFSFRHLSPSYAYRTHIYLLQKFGNTATLDSFITAFHTRFPLETKDAYLQMLYVQKNYQQLNYSITNSKMRSSEQDILFAMCNIQLKNHKEALSILDSIRIEIENNIDQKSKQGAVYRKKMINNNYESIYHLSTDQLFTFWQFSKNYQKASIACSWQAIFYYQINTFFKPISTEHMLLIEPYFLDIRRANSKRNKLEQEKWMKLYQSQQTNCK